MEGSRKRAGRPFSKEACFEEQGTEFAISSGSLSGISCIAMAGNTNMWGGWDLGNVEFGGGWARLGAPSPTPRFAVPRALHEST